MNQLLVNFFRSVHCSFTRSWRSVQMMSSKFSVDNYDSIGFDLDNTLVEYNLKELTKLSYNALVTFLVEKKGYDSNFLYKPLHEDFLQKGLFLDLRKGNVVKLGENGSVLRACHGTKFMTEPEIKTTYGQEKLWDDGEEYASNPLKGWNIPLEESTIRPVLDNFDMPCALIFARLVDSLDSKAGKTLGNYNLWPDMLEGLYYIFQRSNFKNRAGGFFPVVEKEPNKYYDKCPLQTIEWLKELKKNKFLFLITGSYVDFANLTAGTGLGKDWKDWFDFIVYYAKKPGFFHGDKPYWKLHDAEEVVPVTPEELTIVKECSQGNWKQLKEVISKKTKIENPRVLYFGDNLIQDVYSPVRFECCDSVAVVRELSTSVSPLWGSYFYEDGKSTFWNSLIKKNAQICISSLRTVSEKSVEDEPSILTPEKGNTKSDYSRL